MVESKSCSLKYGDGDREEAMHKHQQVSKFEEYVKSRERKIKRALSEIEKRGAAAALDKCRVLAEHIDDDLRNKKVRHLFNNISLLAEFQVSIERAASVLDCGSQL
jgi:alpha-D-ribose 1-methylphosphonate 5-triphosphate diphosphatase PhnM